MLNALEKETKTTLGISLVLRQSFDVKPQLCQIYLAKFETLAKIVRTPVIWCPECGFL